MKGHDNTHDFSIIDSHHPLIEEKKMVKLGELCNVPNFALGHNGQSTFSIFMKVVKGMLKVK